jgi:glycerol-3-phosphate dehydrogenase
VLVGPTARYIDDKNDYEKDPKPTEYFAKLAQMLVPGVQASDLTPAYSGIRAKLIPPPSGAGTSFTKSAADFIIERDPEFPAVVQLMGIESPGLTSAPAIAEHVGGLVGEILA